MGNVLKKEDPLEKAKREAARVRAAKLKAKRRSTVREVGLPLSLPTLPASIHLHCPPVCPCLPPQWDPSGTSEQGPSIVQHETEGWKASASARASMPPVKEWDASGEEAPDLVNNPDHAVSWKAAIDMSADTDAKEKLLRRHSKRPSTVAGLSGELLPDSADRSLGLPPPSSAPPPRAPAETRLSLMKRASATDTGGYDMSPMTSPGLPVVTEGPTSPEDSTVAMV